MIILLFILALAVIISVITFLIGLFKVIFQKNTAEKPLSKKRERQEDESVDEDEPAPKKRKLQAKKKDE